jgi:hypothetical protein
MIGRAGRAGERRDHGAGRAGLVPGAACVLVFAPRPRLAFGGIMNGAAGSESSNRLAREPDHHVGHRMSERR